MNQSIIFALVAMLFWGIADFWVKIGMNKGIDGIAIIFYSMLFTALLIGMFGLVKNIPIKPSSNLLFYAGINGLLLSIGTIAIIFALQYGEVSVAVPIGRLSLIITLLCAIVFLGEKITWNKAVGIILAIGAILFLSKE